MAKVVGLNGQPVSAETEPNIPLVELLEELLDMARTGHLRGAALVTITADVSLGTTWGGDADSLLMLSGLALLNHRIAKHIDENS